MAIILPICLLAIVALFLYWFYRHHKAKHYLHMEHSQLIDGASSWNNKHNNQSSAAAAAALEYIKKPPSDVQLIKVGFCCYSLIDILIYFSVYLKLFQIVSRCRFGSVWKAKLGVDDVAVKIFPHDDADAWMLELG